MGILNESQTIWTYSSKDERYVRNKISLGLKPSIKFVRDLTIRKLNKNIGEDVKCRWCDRKLYKNMRVILTRYSPLCQYCILEFVKNSKEELDKLKEHLEEQEKKVIEDKDKWEKEILLSSL